MKYNIKDKKTLSGGWIYNFYKSPKIKTWSASKELQFYAAKVMWDVLEVPTSVFPLHLVISFNLPLGSSSSYQNHIKTLIFCIKSFHI